MGESNGATHVVKALACAALLLVGCAEDAPPALGQSSAAGPESLDATTSPASPAPGAVLEPNLPLECRSKDGKLLLQGDELPPQLPTSWARLPAWHQQPQPDDWVAREGRPLQVARWSASASGSERFRVYVVDGPGQRVRTYNAATLTHIADHGLASAPAELLADARPLGQGGALRLWASLPSAGQVVRFTPGGEVDQVLKIEGRPTHLALAATDHVRLVTSKDVLVVGNTAPPELRFFSQSGKLLHQMALPAPPLALRGPLLSGVLVLLEGRPPLLAAPAWADLDTGFAKATSLTDVPLRQFGPAHLQALAADQNLLPLSPGGARAGTCDAERCYVAHTLANNGTAAPLAVSSGYGMAPSSKLDPCLALPLRPLEVAVSATSRSTGSPAAAHPAPAVRDPQTQRNLLARFDSPVDAVLLRHADVLAVAMSGSANALLLSLATEDPLATPLGWIELGAGPQALVEVPPAADSPAYLLALDAFGEQLRRIPLQPLANAVQKLGPWTPLAAPLQLKADLVVAVRGSPLSAQLQRGREVFFTIGAAKGMARNERLACGSCHPGGGTDGRTWSSPNGARNTPILAGRLAGSQPFGWGGEESTVVKHLQRTIERLEGQGLAAADLQALLAYLDSMEGAAPGSQPSQAPVDRGAALFFSAQTQCGTCHIPPLYLDGKKHELGTVAASAIGLGKAIDTPSLLGVGRSAPYLHDGSAPSLWQLLAKTSTTMGHSADLTDSQRMDLLAFLYSL